jgi:hypothetical protein
MRLLMRIIVVTFVGFTVAIAVRTIMWEGPLFSYRITRPSIRSECANIRAGMTWSDLDRIVHSKSSPGDESLDPQGLNFSSDQMCQVDLDPATHQVLRARLLEKWAEESQ